MQGRNIYLEENANYVLVGIRRAGKSYMLYQQIQQLVAQGHLEPVVLRLECVKASQPVFFLYMEAL